MNSTAEIKEAYAGGAIDREKFWLAMQERHFALRQYHDLIGGTTVEAIEITGDELIVRTRAGVRLVWHPEDLRTAPNVLVNSGSYDPEESALLMRAAEGANVIFDVGANVGFYSTHWAKAMRAGGKVFSFEPVPTTYERLVRNVELNNLSDIIQTNSIGLGDAASTLTIYLPAFSGSGAASLKNLHPEETSIEVPVCIETLDAFAVAANIGSLDLMKVDVEGAEIKVLQGGVATIERHKPLLFMELLRKWSKPFGYHPNDVIQLLGKSGYVALTMRNGKLVEVTSIDDDTVETNFFFAHSAGHAAWLQAAGTQTH